MFVSYLGVDEVLPDPLEAPISNSGVIAVGGALTTSYLLQAYSQGTFPWYSSPPILWWNPNPRMVLFVDEFICRRSLRKVIAHKSLHISMDTCFADVILACSQHRAGQGEGSWLQPPLIDAYIQLHNLGFAHSVEVFYNNKLVGGLYGLCLGRMFYGESMFSRMNDTSKVALYHLVRFIQGHDFNLIDCQAYTPHLASLGARMILRVEFLGLLKTAINLPFVVGSWEHVFNEYMFSQECQR